MSAADEANTPAPLDPAMEALIDRYLDRVATADELDRLDRAIVADPRVADAVYLAAFDEHVLREVTVDPTADASRQRPTRGTTVSDGSRLRPWVWVSAVAACLMVALYLRFGVTPTTPVATDVSPVTRPTAPDLATRPALPPGVSPNPVSPEAPAIAVQPETAPGQRATPGDLVAPPAHREDRPPWLLASAGPVRVERAGKPIVVSPGDGPLQSEDAVITGAGGAAAIYYDREPTRLSLGADTTLELDEGPGKRFRLEGGVVTCNVAPQPADRPLIVATPQGAARVVGTGFTLTVIDDATRLEVTEGKVLFRRSDGMQVDVSAGEFVEALESKSVRPKWATKPQGRDRGEHWQKPRPVDDDDGPEDMPAKPKGKAQQPPHDDDDDDSGDAD